MGLFNPDSSPLPADVRDALRRIDDLLDDERLYEGTREGLESMRDWIREHRTVTREHLAAFDRIEGGLAASRRYS